MVTPEPIVSTSDFERATGWELKPEGACRGQVCVPLPRPAAGAVDLREVAPSLRMPLVRDEETGLWALGPAAGAPLSDVRAPNFTLPDRRGGDFALSTLRGRKVAVVAWAPW